MPGLWHSGAMTPTTIALPADAPATRVVKGACPHDCPDTCALRITVEGGRVIRVAGDPDHPPTHGALCTKCASA